MKRQEDIIREKLEAFEEVLPEGSLADFRSRYEASKAAAGRKPARTVWYYAAAALAACLAAVFVLNRQGEGTMVPASDRLVEVVRDDQPRELAADVVEDVKTVKAPDAVRIVHSAESVYTAMLDEADAARADAEVEVEVEVEDAAGTEDSIETADGPDVRSNADFKINPDRAVVSVLGGTAIGGLLAIASPVILKSDMAVNSTMDSPEHPYGSPPDDPYIDYTPGEILKSSSHSIPLKLGASIRWILTERLSLTSGLEYSRYSSTFRYSESGKHRQQAHYLGIPVRADYSFARSRWLDAYAGAGGTVDYCLAARDYAVSAGGEGTMIPKDGISLSLQAAAGAQLNLTPALGIYLEPQLTWAVPSETRVLETYRTEHPLSFNISTGLRITLGK